MNSYSEKTNINLPLTGREFKRFKLEFNKVFKSRVNQFSNVEYLKVKNIPNKGEDPFDVPVIRILRDELLELNNDTEFYFLKDSSAKGYNYENELVFESSDWDTLKIYPEADFLGKLITRLELPIIFRPKEKGNFQTYFNVPYRIGDYYLLDSINMRGESYIPSIKVSNFTFEPQRLNSGISKQKGEVKIQVELSEIGLNPASVDITSIYVDPNSPNKNLFSSFEFKNIDLSFENFEGINTSLGVAFDLEFELNTDMATTNGTKFARLVVVSDAAPADENGELQYVENSYLYEFDGEFYKDNPTALSDGGYIQVEIVENTQSSIEELTKEGVKILNRQPIVGNQLNLELPKYLNNTITLSDIEGNILRTVEANGSQISIDISALSSGAYFINISDGKNQVTKKFMIER